MSLVPANYLPLTTHLLIRFLPPDPLIRPATSSCPLPHPAQPYCQPAPFDDLLGYTQPRYHQSKTRYYYSVRLCNEPVGNVTGGLKLPRFRDTKDGKSIAVVRDLARLFDLITSLTPLEGV